MRFLSYLVTLLVASLIAACGGGGGSPGLTPGGGSQAFFTTAPNDLTLTLGNAQNFAVGGGKGPFTAISNNSAVAVATLTDSVLTLTAVGAGSATVTLRDAAGATASVGITVSPSQAFFTTAPAALTLTMGSAQTFVVGGGKGPYTATSNNNAVAVSSLTDTSLTVGAVSPGSATVTLRDAAGAQTSVVVTVRPNRALFTTAPTAVTIPVGNSSAQTYQIGGGVGPYVVGNSNPGVLSASLSGTTLTLTGLATGSANLVILDSVGSSIGIAVTVPSAATLNLFTTAPPAVTTSKGTATTYSIGGGVSPYTVTSSNTGVVSVTQGAGSFTITGVANGTASIVIRDSAGNTVTVGVTVSAAQMSVNPTQVNAYIGDTVYSTISGGTAPYSIVEGFPEAADVDIGNLSGTTFTPNSSGNVLRIVVKQVVASDIILVRDATGNAVSFTLTATAGTNIISLAPSTLTIGEEFVGDIELVLRGAVGTTNIFSSNPDMIRVTTPVTATVPTTRVKITKTAQQICATGEVTISAIDSTGSKAVSVITVEDHGGNPDPCPPVVPTP